MFIENTALSFVLDSAETDFFLENEERAIGEIEVAGKKVPISVKECRGQVHVEAHLHHRIAGKATFVAYERLVQDERTFDVWIDPSDGETKVISHLEAYSSAELDRSIVRIRETLDAALPVLDELHATSKAQTKEEKEAYDISDLLLRIAAFND